MKLNRRKKHAISVLAKRWAVITVAAFLMGILIVYPLDRFLGTRVFIPLFKLGMMNSDISYYKECEATLQGHVDTTEFSDTIREITKERQEKFYHSDDKVIAYISTRHTLVKMALLPLSGIVIVLLPLVLIVIFYLRYSDAYMSFRRMWRRS